MSDTQANHPTAQNKQLVQTVFAELAKGNRAPFRELLADDVQWTVMGSTKWSRTYVGRQALYNELFGPVHAMFAEPRQITIQRVIADGDIVVVEYRGNTTTKAGRPYHQCYCLVFRLADGKAREASEYHDSALVDAVL